MSTTSKVLTGLIALLLAALLIMEVVVHMRQDALTGSGPDAASGTEPAPEPRPAPEPPVAVSEPADGQNETAPADDGLRPWEESAQPEPGGPVTDEAARPDIPAMPEPELPILDEAQMAEMQTLQLEMARLSRQKEPDLEALDQALVRMEEITGEHRFGGIDLHALRENLSIAGELQSLAEQMQAEAERGDDADLDRIEEMVEQMQALQSQLHVDVDMEAFEQ